MSEGRTGRIAHVDLTRGVVEMETPPESFYRKYFGGSAMGMYYILKQARPGIDPLGPENVLTLFVSLLTGAPISGQSRMTANAKSPLVDGIGELDLIFARAEFDAGGLLGVFFIMIGGSAGLRTMIALPSENTHWSTCGSGCDACVQRIQVPTPLYRPQSGFSS